MEIIQHGVIYSAPECIHGYVGWPTIAKLPNGSLNVVASGHRFTHLCPWGRTWLWESADEGQNWAGPSTINNTPLDDRDAGIIPLSGSRRAVTWFTVSSKGLYSICENWYRNVYKSTLGDDAVWKRLNDCVAETTDDTRRQWFGSWIRISPDGEFWGEMRRAPVSSPHGFIVLKDGSWLYVGKEWKLNESTLIIQNDTPIQAYSSADEGKTWNFLGTVHLPEDMPKAKLHEPYAIQLADGAILAAVRYEAPFSTFFATSADGGKTWTQHEQSILGAPPHMLLHSSGKIICTVTRRDQPFGIFAAVSDDNGVHWSEEMPLRPNAPDWDLGYPSSVELANGEILTAYYIKLAPGKNTSLAITRWKL